MSQSTPKISLSFSKKIEKKNLKTSAIGKDNYQISEAVQKHSISSFDEHTKFLKPTKPDDVVIPLVVSKRDSIIEKLKQKSSQEKKREDIDSQAQEGEPRILSLDEQAAAEIEKESRNKIEALQNKSSNPQGSMSIKVNIRDSSEENQTQLMGHISKQEDYEQINVSCFGAAMLRGMGWNAGKGIGKQNKVVEIITPAAKTFGQVDVETAKKKAVEEINEEDQLKKGSFVLIHSGRSKGTYGIVESVDEDHLLIRPANGERILREVEQNLRQVSAKEFKQCSRVINQEMYNKFKAEQEKKSHKHSNVADDTQESRKRRKEDSETSECDDKRYKKEEIRNPSIENKQNRKREDSVEKLLEYKVSQKDSKSTYKRTIKEPSSPCNKYEPSDRGDRKGSSKEIRRERNKNNETSKKKDKSQNNKEPSIPVIPWACENLRVRIIDKNYKRGIYHKQKVLVQSVETVNNCTCVDDEGRVLYDVDPGHLETVIPKAMGALVLVVKGKYLGQKGRILELDKGKEKASLQFVSDQSMLVQLHYDDICEFKGR